MVYAHGRYNGKGLEREMRTFKQVFFVTSSIIMSIAFVGFLYEIDWKKALFLAIFMGFGFGAMVSIVIWPAIYHLKEWKRTGRFFR